MNKRWGNIIFITVVLLIVVLQVSFLGRWKISAVYFSPALVALILKIFLGGKFKEIFGIALAAGLIPDAFSGLSFGVTAFSLILTVWLADIFLIFLPHKNILHFFPFVILNSIIFNFSIFGLMKLIFIAGIYPYDLSINIFSFSAGVLSGALANAVLGALFYIPFKQWIIS